MKVTQHQVAKATGLDVSSVSKILNGNPEAKFMVETVRKVMRAARSLGYKLPVTSKIRLIKAIKKLLVVHTHDEKCAAVCNEIHQMVFGKPLGAAGENVCGYCKETVTAWKKDASGLNVCPYCGGS